MNAGSLVAAIICSLRYFNVVAVGSVGKPACANVSFQELDDLTTNKWTKRKMATLQDPLKTAACACTKDLDEDDAEGLTVKFPVFGKKNVVPVEKDLPTPVVLRKFPSPIGKAMNSLQACAVPVGMTLVVVVMWAIISGIIVWALDHSENSDQFPKSFFHGVREASWWALVTMTTVGYGDKTPKSMLARAYSVVWMLVGIVTISILTAEITSTLTTIELDEQKIEKVGVPRGGEAFFGENSPNGNHAFEVKEFDSQADLKIALDKGAVDAIVVYYCGSEFSQDEYYAVRTIRFPPHWLGVGVFLNADGENEQVESGDLFKCLKKKTRKIFKNATRRMGGIASSKRIPCDEAFRGAQRKKSIRKEEWLYIVTGSAALLVFLLGVGSIYSWQFQTATANVHGAGRSELPTGEALTVPGAGGEIPLKTSRCHRELGPGPWAGR